MMLIQLILEFFFTLTLSCWLWDMCPLGMSHSADDLARKPRSCSSNPHSPVWPAHRGPCRAAARPPPRTGGRTPCTRRGERPRSTRSARWCWGRTFAPWLPSDLCGRAGWGWRSDCRAGPGTWGWWWAHTSARWCPCRTGTRQKCRSFQFKAGGFWGAVWQTHVFAGLRAEGFAPHWVRPLEAKSVHQGFAARPALLAQPSAGRFSFSRHTLGNVDGAEERSQMSGAVHLYHGVKLVQLEGCFLLTAVAEHVGHDGLGVGRVFAERNSDRLAGRRGHCRLPLEGHKQSGLFLQT